MKLKVYPVSEELRSQYFTLREVNNRIELVAVADDGCVLSGGCILEFSCTGIRLFSDVSDKLGLSLDAKKCVIIKNKKEKS